MFPLSGASVYEHISRSGEVTYARDPGMHDGGQGGGMAYNATKRSWLSLEILHHISCFLQALS